MKREASIEEIKKFLIEKVEALRRELSFYENLLRLLEHAEIRDELALQKRIIEIKVDNKTIGIIERHPNALFLKLTKELNEKLFDSESLSKRLKILGEGIKVNVSTDDKGLLRELEISGITSSVLLDGVIEIVRQYLVDRYYMSIASKK